MWASFLEKWALRRASLNSKNEGASQHIAGDAFCFYGLSAAYSQFVHGVKTKFLIAWTLTGKSGRCVL